MSMIGISVKLDRVDKGLLFQDTKGSLWLSAVLTFETDTKGRMIIAQSVPKEKYAAGERGPKIGTWREIGAHKERAGGDRAISHGKPVNART
jgi:hypothetical protein